MPPRSVLIVDDEPSLADLVAGVLAHRGFRVVSAHDGAQALRSAATQRFDLIVMDVMMPLIDGVEVCRQLREDPRQSRTRIVLCSAADEVSVEWREAGADAFLQKPFTLSTLASTLERVASDENGGPPAPGDPRAAC